MITHKKMIQTVVLIMSIVIVFIAFCPYIQASAFIAFSSSNGKRYSFSKDDLSLIYQSTKNFVKDSVDSNDSACYGNDWLIMDLARDDEPVPNDYLDSVIQTLETNNGNLHTNAYDYTNYARVTLALTSLGTDASNIAGYNLIEKVANLEEVQKQGINGIAYALLALDSGNYAFPEECSFTRKDYVKTILDAQLPDFGWDFAGKEADPDMTAIIIQALAPYYDSDTKVKEAVDAGLNTLSALQQGDGGFTTPDAGYAESSESCAMVILALLSLNIDPDKDERFIKNGLSPIDNLCSFAAEDGGFLHILDGRVNPLATDQCFRALVGYNRFKAGKTSFYDMTDQVSKQAQRKTKLPVPASSLLWIIPIVMCIAVIILIIRFKRRNTDQ